MTLLLLSLTAFAGDDLPPLADLLPDTPSYDTAVKRMYEVNKDHGLTLYCGCSYKGKTPDLASCGLEGQTGLRWERTETEHVVPAASLGAGRSCWEEGGRDLCEREDPIFQTAYTDLHNLWPAVGGINASRSNKAMGLLAGDDLAFGSCDFEVDVEGDRVEPRPEVRGDIARIYFYMEWMYGVPISDGQRRLLLHWSQTDPVDEWEKKRDERINEVQGNSNPFVR
jgi:deoxyribonuclease-1